MSYPNLSTHVRSVLDRAAAAGGKVVSIQAVREVLESHVCGKGCACYETGWIAAIDASITAEVNAGMARQEAKYV